MNRLLAKFLVAGCFVAVAIFGSSGLAYGAPYVSCPGGFIAPSYDKCPPVQHHYPPPPQGGHGGNSGLLGGLLGGLI